MGFVGFGFVGIPTSGVVANSDGGAMVVGFEFILFSFFFLFLWSL